MRRILAALAAALFTAALTAAAAMSAVPLSADPGSVEMVKVSYADLNLGSDAGMKTLERRIQVATDKVCGDETAAIGEVRRLIKRCKQTARPLPRP